MNYKELNRIIDESGLKRSHIAKQLQMTDAAFSKRTSGATYWKVGEVAELAKILGLSKTKAYDIFLS